MSETRNVPFNDIEWAEDAPGIRAREVTVDGARWAIVEYAEGVSRDEWCEEGHRGYVLKGEIEYEFDDNQQPLRSTEGQAFILSHASIGSGAHRGRNLASGPTRLFLIDDRPDG